MSPRVEFEPRQMRATATLFEQVSVQNHDILEQLSNNVPLFDIPKADLAHHIMPRLTRVRHHAGDRRRALREVADFMRARALLAEVADGTRDAKGKVSSGKADGLLPKGADAAVGGVTRGIEALARKMERDFLKGGWIGDDGRLRPPRRGPKGVPVPNSWSKLSKIAKRLPLLGKADSAVQLFNALFGKGAKGKRIEAVSKIVGGLGGSAALATATSIALVGGPPGLVGVAVLGAAILGSELGAKAGEFIGKNIIKPLWNGVKSIAEAVAELGKAAFGLARDGLKLIGIDI